MPIKLTTSTITCLYFLNYQRDANCTSILTNHRCCNQRLCNSRRVCCTRLEHHVRQFTLYWDKTNLHEISRVSMIMEESFMNSCCHIFEMGLYHNKISRWYKTVNRRRGGRVPIAISIKTPSKWPLIFKRRMSCPTYYLNHKKLPVV